MNINDIDCIKSSFNGSIIYYSNGKFEYVNVNPTKCVLYLCKEFDGYKLTDIHGYKFPYLIKGILFQPTKSIRSNDCEYINFLHITSFKKDLNGCQISFLNHNLYFDLTPRIIYKYLNLNILTKLRIETNLLTI